MRFRGMLILAASVVSLVLTVGHSIGGMSGWLPVEGNADITNLGSMHFDVFGSQRSVLEMYFGFGLIISFMLFQQTILIAMASSVRLLGAWGSRIVLMLCILACVPSAVVSAVYLFVVPATCFAAISILLIVAVLLPFKAVSLTDSRV